MNISLHYGLLIPTLLLPVFILLNKHPVKGIRVLSVILLFLDILIIIGFVPIYVLIELKFWVLLYLIIPLIFRLLSFLTDKMDITNDNRKVIIKNLLFSSFASSTLIILFASFNYLEEGTPLVVGLFIFLLTFTKQISKYPLVSAVVAGIVPMLFPGFDKLNSYFTIYIVWIIVQFLCHLTLKITKKKRTMDIEKVLITVIIIVSSTLLLTDTNVYGWADISLYGIFLISFLTFIYGIPYTLESFKMNRTIKHYSPIFVAVSVSSFLVYFGLKYTGLLNFLRPIYSYIFLIVIAISLPRCLSPLDKKASSSSPFKLDNIYSVFILWFGKKIGIFIFSNLFGKHYKEINQIINLIMISLIFIFTFLIPSEISSIYKDELFDTTILITVITINSIIATMTFFNELIHLIELKSKSQGLSKEKSLKISTSLALQYVFMILPLVILSFSLLSSYISIITIIIFIILFFLNINISLFIDLISKENNNFKRVRYNLSQFLQLCPLLLCLLLILLHNLNDHLLFWLMIFTFLSTILAKLVGYDLEIGSKKHYKLSLKTFLVSLLSLLYFQFPISSLFEELITIKNFIIFVKLLILLTFSQSLAIILIVPTNNSNNSIFRDWHSLFKR